MKTNSKEDKRQRRGTAKNSEEDNLDGYNDNKENYFNLADQNLELPSDLDVFTVESWLRQKTSSIS